MLKACLIKFIFVNIIRRTCFFKFLDSFFVYSKWSASTINKSGCFKCISGINLSPANKNLLTISFIFIHCVQNKISPSIGTLLNGVSIPNLLKNPFASRRLINLDFLLPHIAHFDNIMTLPLQVLETSISMFSVFFLHFKQYDSIFIRCEATSQFDTYVEKLFFKKCIQ